MCSVFLINRMCFNLLIIFFVQFRFCESIFISLCQLTAFAQQHFSHGNLNIFCQNWQYWKLLFFWPGIDRILLFTLLVRPKKLASAAGNTRTCFISKYATQLTILWFKSLHTLFWLCLPTSCFYNKKFSSLKLQWIIFALSYFVVVFYVKCS